MLLLHFNFCLSEYRNKRQMKREVESVCVAVRAADGCFPAFSVSREHHRGLSHSASIISFNFALAHKVQSNSSVEC